jgi:Sulfotransferase domain
VTRSRQESRNFSDLLRPSSFAREAEPEVTPKLDFVVVGAPKCGTTAIYAYLRQHPDVFMPHQKEPHFFGSDLIFVDQHRPSPHQYARLFAQATPGQRIGEASVFYLFSRHAPLEIHRHSENARIIVSLRNPIDAMHSFFRQRLFNGTEETEDFQQALDLERERKAGRCLPRNVGFLQGLYYRELVDFPAQLRRYFDVFGRKSVHVLLHDDLLREPLATFRGICEFIRVDPSFEPEIAVVNPSKRPRSGWFRDQIWKPSPWLRQIGRALAPSSRMRQRIGLRLRSWNTVIQHRPPIDPDLRRQLVAEFTPAIRQLEDLLGRDLAAWRSG